MIVIVWNNRGYGEIRKYMVARDITPVGVDPYRPISRCSHAASAARRTRPRHPARWPPHARDATARAIPTVIEIDEATWFAQVQR